MTTPAVRPEDRPLHQDIRVLASSLGRVIRRLEGEATFQAVEELRRRSQDRRIGTPGALTLDGLLEHVEGLPLDVVSPVARAFALLFVLVNTAEQVHRVRRRYSYRSEAGRPQHASVGWLFDELRGRGVSVSRVRELMNRTLIRPVLTAHPTEPTPSAILNLQGRLAEALLRREREWRLEAQEQETAQFIEREIELLWLTDEQRDRPSVLDEARTANWYLEERLIAATAAVSVATERAFRDAFGLELNTGPRIEFGSWVGGDRDGNPFVTPEITIAATRRTAHALVARYRAKVDELFEYVTISDRIAPATAELRASLDRDKYQLRTVWETNRKIEATQPLRLKLLFVAARLEAVRRNIAFRDAGRPELEPEAYQTAEEFVQDLELMRRALVVIGADFSRRTLLEPLTALVYALGFHGYALDLRENAAVHARAVHRICEGVGLAPLTGDALRRDLLGRRVLVADHHVLDDEAMKTLRVLRAMRTIQDEFGQRAASTYVVANTTEPDDILNVLLLAREAGLTDLCADIPTSRLDVVPAFETRDELSRAPSVMLGLFADPVYRRQLHARSRQQEVMLGYSDAAKEVGMIAASWEIYVAQERLAALATAHDIGLTLFHGRGGAVARGGGSTEFRSLGALPPGTIGGGLKITEQGEVSWYKYGLQSIAERSLEVMVTGALLAGATDFRNALDPQIIESFRACMEELSEASHLGFRRLIHDTPELLQLFLVATPVRELVHFHRGSRPAYRGTAGETIADVPAIDWNFGWTQTRWMASAWVGAGAGLTAILKKNGGADLLRAMTEKWPFFDELLNKIELAIAEADLEIARLYVNTFVPGAKVMAALEEEFERTRAALLEIRGRDFVAAHRFLGPALATRNPYGDALSTIQVSLLRRKRALSEEHPDVGEVEAALRTTFVGLAQAMRNTG